MTPTLNGAPLRKRSPRRYVRGFLRLSEFEAQAFEGYVRGKDYHRIAADLGCPVKAVDNALQRIKKKIEENVPHVKFQ
jgi:DNA-directed RNA polymerase specialized sigma24 family protein